MTISNPDYARYSNELENINRVAISSPTEFIAHTEETFHAYLAHIAQAIDPQKCRIVMLSGPSSSGKTTTAHILMDALEERGVRAVTVSLDNFYLGECNAPLLKGGRHDYESVYALDVPAIKACLRALMEEHTCNVPCFDFTSHSPTGACRHVDLGPNGVAIVEGIHALNPLITEGLPEGVTRCYLSVKQGIDDVDGRELLSPNEVRLVRRLVRDFHFRASEPERTLSMWDTVMEGEYKYIKPFRATANYTVNSLHSYEPCVLRHDALPLLRKVPAESPHYAEARRLLAVMEQFCDIDAALVPQNSIIREFIGGGLYA